MPALLDSKLIRPLDPTLRGNDLLAQTSLLSLVNNPGVQDPNMSPADKLEQQQSAAMLAESLGGPSAEEQAAQAEANPSLKRRKGPARPFAPIVDSSPVDSPTASIAELLPGIQTKSTAVPAAESSPILAIPFAASVAQAQAHKIFFTGRSGAGKSFLANLVGARVLEFNTTLIRTWTGPPPTPAVLVQLIAWANGIYDAQAPNTAERGLFVQLIRGMYSLEDFGTPDFLAKQLIREAALQMDASIIAVTEVQTVSEFAALKDAGFQHFHVVASQTTMQGRVKRPRDEKLAAHLDGQASTLMQKEPEGGKKPVIWSDPITASPCQRFYTPEEFKQLFVAQAPIEGVEL